MSDSSAESLDGDRLGEEIGDDGLPGIGDYPPDTALGVNDPNLVAPDDVAMREARTRSEELPGEEAARAGDLLPPAGDQPGLDAEPELVGEVGSTDQDGTVPPAEVDAVREID